MLCVRTISYSVLFREEIIGPIFPRCGLRQGDLISPYLFILAVEGLSNLISKKEEEGLIHDVQISSSVPRISHLFLADDLYLFFKPSLQESTIVKIILSVYKDTSS